MSRARHVRRRYHALHLRRLDQLLEAPPTSGKASSIRDAMDADREQRQSFEAQEHQFARWRRARSLTTSAQILIAVIAVVAVAGAAAAAVLHPGVLAGVGLGTALAAVVGLLAWTWRRGLRDVDGRSNAEPSQHQQLVLDFAAAQRRRRLR